MKNYSLETTIGNYYKLEKDETGSEYSYHFSRLSDDDIKICDRSIDEIITILNGLEIERITNIKMTMENLSYLYKELLKEKYKQQQEAIKEMLNL